jgi:hypothetical protein
LDAQKPLCPALDDKAIQLLLSIKTSNGHLPGGADRVHIADFIPQNHNIASQDDYVVRM